MHLIKAIVITLTFFFNISYFIVAQEADKTFEFGAALTGDFGRNFNGGIECGNTYLGNIDLTALFNTENAKLWKGGTFFAYALNNHGNSLSQFVGDFQGIDNIEAESNTRLYQLWYSQQFKNFSITIGQHDLNSLFCASEYGATFIHSSFGIQPDISTNVPASIFPVASLGAILQFNLSRKSSFLFGVYDGNPGEQNANRNSLEMRLDKNEGYLGIMEYAYSLQNKDVAIGSYKLGLWTHTIDSHYGIYVIGDQKLYTETNDKNQGIGFFTQIGFTPNNNSFIGSYYSFGLHYTGLLKGRDNDNMGVAIGNAFIADKIVKLTPEANFSNETAVELTYKALIGKHLIIQPDLQYIIKPGGSTSIANSFIGILRVVARL